MNRFYIMMLSLSLAFGKIQAQSQTYQIEVLSKPEKLLPKVPSDSLYKTIEKDFVQYGILGRLYGC